MNVKTRVNVIAFWLILLVLVWPVSGMAAWSLEDPLLAVPDVIGSGVTLPGDNEVAPCPVEKDFTIPLALDEAVDLALCNNPQIQEAWANIKIEAGALGEARAAYLPTATGTFSRIKDRTSHPDSAFAGTTIFSNTLYGTATWRLFDFGARAANREAAEQLLAAALANHDATLQKTLSAVIEAYYDVYTQRAALSAKIQSEEIATNTLNAARKRETMGASAQSDTLQATTALAKATLEKNRARGDYQ